MQPVPRIRGELRAVLSRPGPALLVVAALATAVRLWDLGWRVAHQDEARVAHWILHYREFGVWEYRPIIHGPFLPHVNGVLFSYLPPSDFSMRLVVALLGGLLPLAAWLFRTRLRDSEVVALALLLAANPLLLYYSRFMRNDLVVAGFMLVAFGLYVRAYDSRDPRYLYAGTLPFALAFTAKELALVYPVSWVGATLLLLDHRLLRAADSGRPWRRTLGARLGPTARGVWRWRWPLGVAALEFFAVVVLFYAPKGTDPGLWGALLDPTALPAVVEEALVGSWGKFTSTWGDAGEEPYIPYFLELGKAMAEGALALLALAAVGFVVDRYSRTRDLIAFTGYWGVAHLVGLPVAVDNPFPWETVHTVVPLAVPAAVGLAAVYRTGRSAVDADDTPVAVAAAVVLLLVAAQTAVVAADTSYRNPQSPDSELIQFAQPAGEMQPTLERIYEVAAQHDGGPDVVYYGEVKQIDGTEYILYQETERWGRNEDPPRGWWSRLPLPWYFDANGVETDSTTEADDFAENPPPVVVAYPRGGWDNPSNVAEDVAPHLDGYCRVTHQGYLHSRPIVFFVRGGTGPFCS